MCASTLKLASYFFSAELYGIPLHNAAQNLGKTKRLQREPKAARCTCIATVFFTRGIITVKHAPNKIACSELPNNSTAFKAPGQPFVCRSSCRTRDSRSGTGARMPNHMTTAPA